MIPCLCCGGIDRRRFLQGLLLFGGGVLGELLWGRSPAWAFTVISESQEEAIGKRAHREIMNKFGYYPDAALQAYVIQIGQRVLREAESTPFEYQFTIVDIPLINAFAVPGGFVYVTRGILAALNSEAELAAVLGHEIAHITSHHSAKQITRALGAQILTLGLAVLSPGGREHTGAWAALSGEIFTQILLGYGREAELEADEKGLRSAVKAGYDPSAMVSFMRTLQLQTRLSAMGYHALRATHPDTFERIDRARVLMEVLRPEQKGFLEVNEDTYKARLEGLVYSEKEEGKRVRIFTAQGGETLKEVAKALWGKESRAWDVALLNGIRNEDLPLRPGQKLKIIYDPFDEHPLKLPKGASRLTP